jgi:hypothetical protein
MIPLVFEKRSNTMGAGPVEDGLIKAQQESKPVTGPQPTIALAVEGSPPPPQTGGEYFGVPEVNPFQPGSQNAARWAAGVRDFPQETENKPATTPEEDLIKAQHLFIEGLLDFVHDRAQVAQFAGDQESYIRASMKYAQAKLDQK